MRNTILYAIITFILVSLNRYTNALVEADKQLDFYKRSDSALFGYIGTWILLVIFAIVIIIHFQLLLEKKLTYESFVAKREAYVLALTEARENGRELEALDILKKTIKWNNTMVDKQIGLRHYFSCEYIDPRFADLKPIK